jgi:hypothetical protein
VTDPTRLIELEEGTSPLERRVLDAGRSIGAPPGAKASVLAAISAQAALSATAAAAVKTSSLVLVAKSLAVGVLLGVAATAGVNAWVAPSAAPPAKAPAAPAPRLARDVPDAAPVPSVIPVLPAPLDAPSKAEPPARRSVDHAPSSAEAMPAAPAAPSQMAFSDAPVEAPRSVSGADRAQLESRRVAEARGLLRAGRTAAGLVVLNELTREFPNGVLVQEREALMIEALLGSGERERARALALEFLQRHPNSPLAASVRRALD